MVDYRISDHCLPGPLSFPSNSNSSLVLDSCSIAPHAGGLGSGTGRMCIPMSWLWLGGILWESEKLRGMQLAGPYFRA